MRVPITPVTTLQRRLRGDLRRRDPAGRVIVAVDGIDGAGKSTFADTFAAVLAEDGTAVFRASIDDFHRPRAERYLLGHASPEGFYRDSYDYATFRRVLVDPFREGWQTSETLGFQLEAFDLRRDAPVESRWVTAPDDAVLVVDGIFLHRPELHGLWNLSIWLEVPAEIASARMAERDGTDPDPAARSNRRYREGQELYLREASPRDAADAVVDNTDPVHPVLLGGAMTAPSILLVDKPGGITSHDVVSRARKALGTRKIGHAGTLDPMATGLLILGVEGATRLLTYIVGLDKTYEATIRLGAATATDDADGEITATAEAAAVDAVTTDRIAEGVAALRGPIEQVPSSVSAIKVDGRRAYDLARAGESVELKARAVTVSRFEVLADRRSPGCIDLDVVVDCSSGTYIRALARDLGESLGVGGHLTSLRRTRIGPFSVVDGAVDPGEAPSVPPAAAAVSVLGAIDVTADEARDLRHGKRLAGAASRLPAPLVAALDPDGELIGIVEARGSDVKSVMNMPEPPR